MADWISCVADAVLAIAALVGAVVAILGLRTWKAQLRQGEDHELARSMLVSLFRYRDAIRNVRNPAMSIHEMPVPPPEQAQNMTDEGKRHYGVAFAYQARVDRVVKVREDMYPSRLEADALWGPDLSTRFQVLEKLERELLSDIRCFLRSQDPNSSEKMRQAYANSLQKKRDILYERESEDDLFRQEFDAGLESIESNLKSKLISAHRKQS